MTCKWICRILPAVAVVWSAWSQGGPPPGGTPPATTTSVTYKATYKLDGGSATQTNQTYGATAADTSGIWVANSGALTLINPTINTSGNTSSQDNSSFYGLNAGLLVTSGAATIIGGTVSTTGSGANGVFATGSGSAATLTNVTIRGTGDGAHAAMATQGGTLTLTNVDMTTTGGSASAVATDRGGGSITLAGGTVKTSGNNSAGIYSTGAITAAGTTFQASGAESAVIEGANSITLANCSLTTTKEKWGVMIYQSMSGDATGTRGAFTMSGGSLTYTPSAGPLFYVNNSTGIITLKRVAVTANSGTLVRAAAGDWGSKGSNGGTVVLTTDSQTLTGDLIADNISSIAAMLTNGSTLKGKITNGSLTLDVTSGWSLTGNSVLTSLSDIAGISGTSVTNIQGNGFTATYDPSLSANSYLGGKTYNLAGGGSLAPASGSTSTTPPSISAAGVLNAASGVAGVAPGAWISIYGSSLSSSATSAGASDLLDGYLPTKLGGTSVTIDGKPAFLNYVGPTQINLQAPDDSATGNVTVTVSNSSGSSSASVAMPALMPGLFTSSNYVVAVRPADSAIVGGSAAANVGDVLEIFATGLGPTSPAVASGLVFSGAYPSVSLPKVTIGGITAVVSYCGLIGAGLYQINLTVPAGLVSSTYPVIVTQDGVSSPATAVMKVAAP